MTGGATTLVGFRSSVISLPIGGGAAKDCSGGLVHSRRGADTPRVYTTCMHDFSGVQEGANGYCVLLRGSAAAAGAILRQHAPYVVITTLVFAH